MNKIPHWNLSFVKEDVKIAYSLNGLILCYLLGGKKTTKTPVNVSKISVLIEKHCLLLNFCKIQNTQKR